jgi:hypothetical protein
LFFESTRWPGETHVARALFTDPLDREPSVHVFYESHVPWLHVDDDLPKKVSQASQAQSTSASVTASGTGGSGP